LKGNNRLLLRINLSD